MAEEPNKELEDWVNMFCDFDSFCDEGQNVWKSLV